MCEANAYIVGDEGNEELFLSNVDLIEPSEQGGLKLTSIYGEQKLFAGKIARMSLVLHKIYLTSQDFPPAANH